MLRVATLGEISAWIGERRISPSASRLFPLLLLLAAEADHWIGRVTLGAMLFPTSDDSRASHSLRQLTYRLRQFGLVLEGNADSIRLPASLHSTDFSHLVRGEAPTAVELQALARGFLPGFAPDFSESYRDWFDSFKSRTVSALLRATTKALEHARHRGQWAEVEIVASACLGLDPANEQATIARAEGLALLGSRSEALRVLECYARENESNVQSERSIVVQLRDRMLRQQIARPQLARLPRLVGRESELARLLDAFDRSVMGSGTLILLWGESGIGKTRLLEALAEGVRLRGGSFARIECNPANYNQPLRGMIAVTSALLDMPGALGTDPDTLSTLKRLVTFGPLDATSPDITFATAAAAFLDLADAVGAERPLVIAVDDTHWLDQESRDVISVLTKCRRLGRVLLVLSGRERSLPASATADSFGVTTIGLKPLRPEAARELLIAELEGHATACSGDQASHMLTWAGGNPLFIRLVGESFRSTRSTDTLPRAVSDLIERRLEGISQAAGIVLAACVLAGTNASFDRIQRFVGLGQFELLTALHELEDRGLVSAHEGCLGATHPSIAERVASSVPPATRRYLHASIAKTLWEDFTVSSQTGLLWDCAGHWERAMAFRSAIEVLRSCARHSRSIGRSQDAVRALERALQLPQPARGIERQLRHEAAAAAEAAGEWDRAASHLSDLRTSASASMDELQRDAEVRELDAKRIVDQLGAPTVESPLDLLRDEAVPLTSRLRAALFLLAQAWDHFDANLAQHVYGLVCEFDPRSPVERGLAIKCAAVFHSSFGELEVAKRFALQSVQLLENSGFSSELLNGAFTTAYALYRTGCPERARSVMNRIVAETRLRGLTSLEQRACTWLAWLALKEADTAAAARWQAAATRLPSDGPAYLQRIGVEIELAIAEDNTPAAKNALARARAFPGVQTPRCRLDLLYYEMRVGELAGAVVCGADTIERAVRDHLRGRSFGEHDQAMAGLLLALEGAGDFGRARRLFREYSDSHRRDPSPIDRELRRISRRLLATADRSAS